MDQRTRRGLGLGLALVAATAALSLPTTADHLQTDAGKAVAFDHRTGNEWWVEAVLSGPDAGSVARVEAQDTGGAWLVLERKSWGAWAASFHIEPGHAVRFRATWGDGAQQVSCWFSHPAGVEACPTSPPSSSTSSTSSTSTTTPPPSGFVFDHKGGNEWWVEATVTGSPARVQAQDEGGAWTELQRKSWGAWAASFRIEAGHDVRFRAGAEGAWTESCWFTHPGGRTPTGGETCGSASSAPPAVSFTGVKGNPYWVEVRVTSDRPVTSVQAQVDDGAWRALALRDWGAWAASFFVPDGAYVQFRATTSDGATATSVDYVWPSARPVGPWPVQGSSVAYDLRKAGGAPDGSFWSETVATLRLTFDGAAWHGRCVGSTTDTDHTGASTTVSFDVAASGAPPRGPVPAEPGQVFDPVLLDAASYGDGCWQAEDALVVEGRASRATSLRDAGGRMLSLDAWQALEPAEASPYEDDRFTWDARLGLFLDWSHAARGGNFQGHLVGTDAPIR